MEWVRDRYAHSLDPGELTAIDAHLVALRDSVSFGLKDLKTASAVAAELQDPLALGPVPAQD